MKQVCVIGLGQFGKHLARTLARMKCEVLAVDMDEQAVNSIRDDVQHAAILDVRQFDALSSVLTGDVDEVVVSLGESLEASVLATLHAAKLGVKRIRAKASGADHAAILEAVGAHEVFYPEKETAERMAKRVMNPDLLDYLPLSPEYSVVEVEVPEAFMGKSLVDLHLRKKYRVLAIAIRRSGGEKVDFMPAADSVLNRSDTLVVIGKAEDIANLPKDRKAE